MPLRATASSGLEVLAGLNADGSDVSWLEKNWPFFSWAMFLFGSGVLAARWRVRDRHWYGWLSVVMYCLHQSEEHAYDVRGWRYAFVPSVNLGPIAGMYKEACVGAGDDAPPSEAISCPLDPKITLYVNTVMIWIGFGGCMVAATIAPRRFLLAGSLNWGTAVVNGISHILVAIVTLSYNPGVAQSICMVPLGIFIIHGSGRPLLCIVNGIVGHAALIAGIKVLFRFHTDEAVTIIAFIVLGALVIPLLISYRVSSADTYNKMR